mmetsp:Transcript_66309/g.158633  ORF Transcript_66309/g.158633 Transcript_66309/m.158633 type:complete len:401 (-) Transcript_66309:253-1455(-)
MVAASIVMVAALLGVSELPQVAQAHGYISMPPLRGGTQGNDRNGYCPHCGNGQTPCGDGNQWPTNSDFLNYESASFTALTAGSVQEFTIRITAHHKGHFEFGICDQRVSGATADPQACFDARKLERAAPPADCQPNDSRGDCQPIHPEYPERWYLPPGGAGVYSMRFKIPADLECSECTLQWRWWTANSCVPAPNYGCFFDLLAAEGLYDSSQWCSFCGDCGDFEEGYYTCGEEFRNCADISVLPGSGSTAPAPATTADPPSSSSSSAGGVSSSTGGSSSSTGAAPSPPPATGNQMCVHNTNCDESAWCQQGDVYDVYCPPHSPAQCPFPHCVVTGGTTAASTTTTVAVTTPATSSTAAAAECVPLGDCGSLGFCDQSAFSSFCAAYSAASCPAPFCVQQ